MTNAQKSLDNTLFYRKNQKFSEKSNLMKEKKEAHKKAINDTLHKLNDKEDLKTEIDNKVGVYS